MKVIVLLSGGMDSTTLLAHCIRKGWTVQALSLDYGQKHVKELEYAEWQASHYNVKHTVLSIRSVFSSIRNPLLGNMKMPEGSYSLQKRAVGPVETYIPNRNMILLSIAASQAIQLKYNAVAYAAHADDAENSAYPDCSPEFFEKMNAVLETQGVQLYAPYIYKTKADIAKEALQLGVYLDKTISCYNGVEGGCGKCATCIDRIEAIRIAKECSIS